MSDGGKGSSRRPGVIPPGRWDAIFKRPKNVRHDLDPVLVAAQIEKQIAIHERHREETNKRQHDFVALYTQDKVEGRAAKTWTREPKTDWVNPMYDDWIERERVQYAKVRVIELPQKDKRFILVYGDEDDAAVTEGSGPFATLDQAKNWFLNGGR